MEGVKRKRGIGGGDVTVDATVAIQGEAAAPDFIALEFAGDVTEQAAMNAPTLLEFAADVASHQSAMVSPTELEAAVTLPNNASRISQYVVDVVDMEARADCWISNVAGCVDNTNHNTDPLQVDGVTATRKDTYIRFPVNSFPLTAFVLSATLKLTLHTATGALTNDISVRGIPDGNEDWAETAPTCSNTLSPAAPLTNFTIPANSPAGTGIAITIASGGLTALEDDMGSRSHTCVIWGALAQGADFHDRLDATPAFRPRLDFTFQVFV